MTIPFFKYQGAGNDFIIVDNRAGRFPRSSDANFIAWLCDRRFGVGADGLMLLEQHAGYDFYMRYYNADGRPGSMCGNGGRCIAELAKDLDIIGLEATFLAVDGPHRVRLPRRGWVELQMQDVEQIEIGADYYFLDTGSPHYVRVVDDLSTVDVEREGRAVRYSPRFRQLGTNVNFIEPFESGLRIATYERGVEGETLACGTGVTAAALVTHLREGGGAPQGRVAVKARGGALEVRFTYRDGRFENIWLCGPARAVYQGTVKEDAYPGLEATAFFQQQEKTT